jgi:hypothetical protein
LLQLRLIPAADLERWTGRNVISYSKKEIRMDYGAESIETIRGFFKGGEEGGSSIRHKDIGGTLADALQAVLYRNVTPTAPSRGPDRFYGTNASFWREALAGRQYPTQLVVLEDFVLMEWLPFSPGRYYTHEAEYERREAAKCVSPDRNEYLPEGKKSMVRGGIGAIRLAERHVRGHTLCFLGASSTGIAHQGVPVALPPEEYRKVMSIIKDTGGCRAKIVGSLQTLSEGMPVLRYGSEVPRYCLFAEEVSPIAPARGDMLTTVAVMFSTEGMQHRRWEMRNEDNLKIMSKSWTFCSFRPGSSERLLDDAAAWLMDYAARYSRGAPSILTDFDEHFQRFGSKVEFPIADILRGAVDWESLRVSRNHFKGTYIENYFEEHTRMGDQINVHGSQNVIVNRSVVESVFNKVKIEKDGETANALLMVEEVVNRSGKLEAVENFNAFNEELSKPEPKKSLLKTLWSGTLEVLPYIKELPGVVDSITKLFDIS